METLDKLNAFRKKIFFVCTFPPDVHQRVHISADIGTIPCKLAFRNLGGRSRSLGEEPWRWALASLLFEPFSLLFVEKFIYLLMNNVLGF